jgi:hypothetical protein
MAELVEQDASLPRGATDASVIAVGERLGLERVATLDRRPFTVVRPAPVEAFELPSWPSRRPPPLVAGGLTGGGVLADLAGTSATRPRPPIRR